MHYIQTFDFQIKMKAIIGLCSIFFFLSIPNIHAQGFKSLFNPRKKDIMYRLDSLQLRMQEQENYYNTLVGDLEKEISSNQIRIHQLEEKNSKLQYTLDSLVESTYDTVKIEEQNEITEERNSLFQVDSVLSLKVEELQQCACFENSSQGIETSPLGLKVVKTGISLVADEKLLVRGSCWKFINTVYNKAGITSDLRETIYSAKKGSRIKNLELVQPGDWIYHVNHSFHNVEHSAIFICWKDFDKKIGITLSHVGQNKLRTGQFGTYDLKSIYNIIRPKEQ